MEPVDGGQKIINFWCFGWRWTKKIFLFDGLGGGGEKNNSAKIDGWTWTKKIIFRRTIFFGRVDGL